MWASEMAKSMIKMQKYKQLMSWLTLLPVLVMLPIFLLVQALMVFCIARIRRLQPICGPLDRKVAAKQELELYYFHDSPCCAKVRHKYGRTWRPVTIDKVDQFNQCCTFM